MILKEIFDQLHENQDQLEKSRVNINDFLKKETEGPKTKMLHSAIKDIIIRWKDLQKICKKKANRLDELKDLYNIHDDLINWINSKGKLMI